MAVDETKLYKHLTDNLDSVRLSTREIAKPDPTIETEVTAIFTQARKHRSWLVYFYIIYTIIFTLFVFYIIQKQADTRIKLNNSNFEIIPQWALNLLVTGMFAQFVGLPTIITKRVWDFRPFFTHYVQMKANPMTKDEKPVNNTTHTDERAD
jgi:hypothetical protein